MADVVAVEIAALPFMSCALSPSPAVILSFDCNKTYAGWLSKLYTRLVLPSITREPNLYSLGTKNKSKLP